MQESRPPTQTNYLCKHTSKGNGVSEMPLLLNMPFLTGHGADMMHATNFNTVKLHWVAVTVYIYPKEPESIGNDSKTYRQFKDFTTKTA